MAANTVIADSLMETKAASQPSSEDESAPARTTSKTSAPCPVIHAHTTTQFTPSLTEANSPTFLRTNQKKVKSIKPIMSSKPVQSAVQPQPASATALPPAPADSQMPSCSADSVCPTLPASQTESAHAQNASLGKFKDVNSRKAASQSKKQFCAIGAVTMASPTPVPPEVTWIIDAARQQCHLAITPPTTATAVTTETIGPLPCQLANPAVQPDIPAVTTATPVATPDTPAARTSATAPPVIPFPMPPSPAASAAAKYAHQAAKDPRRAKTTSLAVVPPKCSLRGPNTVVISTSSPRDYREARKVLTDRKLEFHSYQAAEDKLVEYCIPDIQRNTPVEAVMAALEKKGFKPKSVVQLTTTEQTGICNFSTTF
ncbi:vegetative cell wall protein gp1-like [Ischnura elegans]|uniref:vegetative cell wall protein gp1-like n=1 Tax=Ischnura elegans TaxID=197161 RepID=UPI001ED87378|nr:vegetative cell wall protein gp1-like [Ischnura elegans]